ncbi:MAG: hypothetical protein TQ37_08370 [Candidatus Synechococcus spongiarum 15L]|uniref:Uncharacterized protein n=2 Tax=Candidatus Synechococcus spongiarum TaxID=431041 RepID=A0A1T1D159_9SYNE|nr:hypothetical protein [Candidatus Synechococcus spongiarum]KKZ10730.1 MAG: hypothetical protein TQ37_08370 [Candidatus Synechococcus spongiarum 15L]OOV34606.1 hypothetical protein BV53_05530 [Candidatus Synechococcus spongiarum LMB bulk15N]
MTDLIQLIEKHDSIAVIVVVVLVQLWFRREIRADFDRRFSFLEQKLSSFETQLTELCQAFLAFALNSSKLPDRQPVSTNP